MEFKGLITKVLPMQTGTSERTGNPWQKQEFVVEYFEHENDRWADRVCLSTMDTKVMSQLAEGKEVVVGFGHGAREYNGRFYNELKLYKFEVVGGAAVKPQPTQTEHPAAAQPQAAQQTSFTEQIGVGSEGKEDDLPF